MTGSPSRSERANTKTRRPGSRDDAVVSTGRTAPAAERRLATWAWIAVVVATVDTIAIGVSGIVAAADHIPSRIASDGAWINLVAAPTFPLLAALVFRDLADAGDAGVGRRRQERLAWLFLGIGVLCTLTAVLFVYAAYGLRHGLPLTLLATWVEAWVWTGVVPSIELLLLWFPSGDIPGPRWRWGVRGAAVAWAGLWLGAAFAPGRLTDFAGR